MRAPDVEMVCADEIKMKRLLVAVFLLLPACSDEFSKLQLLGVYIANYRGETATLSLKADHTYTHVIQLKGAQTLEAGSTWKASRVTSGLTRTVVEFSNFRVIPSFGEAKKVGWASEVERTWLGRIQLCFDSDVGYCYVKQVSSSE
jgi:hypothetical protein